MLDGLVVVDIGDLLSWVSFVDDQGGMGVSPKWRKELPTWAAALRRLLGLDGLEEGGQLIDLGLR